MEIKNSEKVLRMLKMKSNIENLLNYINEHEDCTVIVSAKAKNLKNKFVFLDAEGVDELLGLLDSMSERFGTKLKEL